MKTYCETKGEKPFDWNRELDSLIAGRELTGWEHDNLSDKALEWTTCACGNQCSIIPRDREGMPLDTLLRGLGSEFFSYVENGSWQDAKIILNDIEARAAIVIAEILAN